MKNIMLPGPLAYNQNNTLTFSGKTLRQIAKKIPTPFYLYDLKLLKKYYKRFELEAKKNKIPKPLICFAVKANSNPKVLKTLADLGSGADVVSVGELKKALAAGIAPEKIVFSGVGKTSLEISFALKLGLQGIYSFNVESIEELVLINHLANKLKRKARVAFRLNPKVAAKTHKHISTGNDTHKFGLLKEDIYNAILNKNYWTHTTLVGLSIHIGSQLTEMRATEKAISELAGLAIEINKKNIELEFLDVGGGLGIDYTQADKKKLTSIESYMQAVYKSLNKHYFTKSHLRPRIVFEPGRIIVGKMGALVTQVVRTKKSAKCHFTIIDAGMNDLVRPALYEAYHGIWTEKNNTHKLINTEVVGPICESTDCFGKRKLPELKAGDLLAIENAGAYGQTMASTYNERPLILEYTV